jgi:hypothetical protein
MTGAWSVIDRSGEAGRNAGGPGRAVRCTAAVLAAAWVVLASGRGAEAQVFGVPAAERGTLEGVSGQLGRLVQLKLDGSALRLDRDHWAAPFGGKTITQLEKEIDAEITKRKLPLTWYKQTWGRPSEPLHVHVLAHELSVAASSYVYNHTGAGWSSDMQIRGSQLEGRLTLRPGKSKSTGSFHLKLEEKAGQRRTLSVDEHPDGRLSLTLLGESSDDLVRVFQRADGKFAIQQFQGAKPTALHGDSFLAVYQKHGEYVEQNLFPSLTRLGIGVPSLKGAASRADNRAPAPPEPTGP